MNTLPIVRLKNAWKSSHPWIFQRLVEKPAQRPKPGEVVDVVGVDGAFIGRGFYNGHSRIALRILEENPDMEDAFEARKDSLPEFRNSWYAQLDWIHKNSRHYEPSHMRYPIYRLPR